MFLVNEMVNGLSKKRYINIFLSFLEMPPYESDLFTDSALVPIQIHHLTVSTYK